MDLDHARQGAGAAAKRAEKAKREDCEVTIHEGIPGKDDYDRLVDGLTAWQDGRSRKGKQGASLDRSAADVAVHTSELKPFRDAEHRIYFVARHPKGGPPQGLLVLSEMLDGYYIKVRRLGPVGLTLAVEHLAARCAFRHHRAPGARGNRLVQRRWRQGALLRPRRCQLASKRRRRQRR